MWLIAAVPGFSQRGDAGTTSIFMETGLGARAQGFGQAFTAIANDGSAVFWNPAGLDYITQSNVVAYHSTLVGAYYNFASFTYPFVNFGSFGMGISRLAVTDIQLYSENFDLIDENASYDEEEFYLSYGKKLPWFGLAVGATFKATRIASPSNDNTGGSVSSIGTGMDFGLLYRPESDNAFLKNLSVGMNVQNLIAPRMKLITDEYVDPMNIKFGVAKDLLFGGEQLRRLTLTSDFNLIKIHKSNLNHSGLTKPKSTNSRIFFGGEFSYNPFLTLRGGFDNGKIALGMGTEFKQFQRFQVDYSVNIGNAIGTTLHRVSLTVNFGKTIEEQIQIAKNRRLEEDQRLITRTQEVARTKAIKEHSSVGKELFKDGKLIQALVEFENVAALDPNNEQAKLYLDSINSAMDNQLAAQLADTAESMKQLTVASENEKFVKDHYRKGYQFIQKGDFLAAINEFQTALERDPNNKDIQAALTETRSLLDKRIGSFIAKARASAAANNFAEALKLLSEARALDPTNQNVQKEIDSELKRISTRLTFLETTRTGLDAYQRGEYQEAMESFEKALLLDPSNETVKEYHKKSIVRAFATFKNLEGNTEKMYLQGVDLYVEGKYQQAIILWQRILENDPYNKRVLNAIDKAEEQLRALQNQQNLQKK